MGMMDQMAPMEQPQAAPMQGMMGGQPQGGGYNGVVVVDGKQVQVVEGVAEVGGQKFLVSDDGSMVVDQDQRIVGYIEEGQFKPMDAERASMLKEKGITE
jgi:hypothetical protein